MRPRHLALLALATALAAGAALRFGVGRAADAPLAASPIGISASPERTASAALAPPLGTAPSPSAAATRTLSATLAPSSSDATATDPPLVRATLTAPVGARVPLDATLIVHFDRAPPPASVALTTEPVAEGQLAWTDTQTLTFTPVRWAEGKPYRVQVSGPGVAPASFELRTMVPPPERVEPGHGARMVLTFDDGADKPGQVVALLDLLEKEQIQAIFFPTGRWAEANPRLLLRMTHDGHRVCNHTYSHQNLRLPQLTEEEIRSEIRRGAGVGTCDLFRPPLKAFDPRVERIVQEMGYKLYLWDIDSRDWEGALAEDIVNLVLEKAHPGAVVLFHMHAQATLDALPVLLPRLRKAGYTFRDPPAASATPPLATTPSLPPTPPLAATPPLRDSPAPP